ncbi:MAG: cupredoxin domain-containing protein [Chloroflexi bacterium]|nr:cupredoxin domain-containing protein [Chloroflexota bacterium]
MLNWKTVVAFVVVVTGLALAAACNGGGGTQQGSPAPQGEQVSVKQDDFDFEPDSLSGDAGQAVTVELENEGSVAHTFTIDELDVDETLQPGDTASVTFTLANGGSFAFYCRFHRSQGMEGTLTVSGGGGGTTPAGTETPGAGGGVPGY